MMNYMKVKGVQKGLERAAKEAEEVFQCKVDRDASQRKKILRQLSRE